MFLKKKKSKTNEEMGNTMLRESKENKVKKKYMKGKKMLSVKIDSELPYFNRGFA